jgi:poly(hydroxyalkanoate) depolymerase family esterase
VIALCCLFASVPARAASVTKVDRGTWGATGVPSYVNMYIYVPAQLATNPPIVVACHSCGTPVSGYVSSITGIQAGADKAGFVLILPEATNQNCWDVGSTKSLTRDGGGDTQAVSQMVKYALTKYNGDPKRVYIMGGSSGAMMTQAMAALYPDVFRAASARAGVPAGCWADGYDSSQQWSNNCAGGNTKKSAQQWGDLVRMMNPSYMGHRPRMQLFQGESDTTISYNNMGESIKEWTNVLGLPDTPSSTDSTKTSIATYDRKFWKNKCDYTVLEAWSAPGGTHSMGYEQDAILAFFGLDKTSATDPEPDCNGTSGGAGGMGGMSAGGASGASSGGAGGMVSVGGRGPAGGTGGMNSLPPGGIGGSGPATSGGTSGGVGASGTGGASSGMGGMNNAAGGMSTGVAGSTGSGGTSVNTGSGGTAPGAAGKPSAGTTGAPGGAATHGSGDADGGSDSGGCSIVAGESGARKAALAVALGLGLVALGRRRRRAVR